MCGLVYLVDVYLLHANSALAICAFTRALFAAGFPMFSTYMYENLGVDWATSLIGFLCLALVPFPLIFLRYGKTSRGWSRFAADRAFLEGEAE